jgi:hypothetical protein
VIDQGTKCLVVMIGLAAAGCLADAADDPQASVQRSIVNVNADGSYEQTFETVTPAQLQAEIDARAALTEASGPGVAPQRPIVAVDSACAGADLWLFDQTAIHGNELCLFLRDESFAFLDLGLLCRNPGCSLGTWSGAVRSLWSGVTPGNLTACTPTLCYAGPGNGFHFNTYQRFDNVAPGVHPLNNIGLFAP